MVVVSHLDDAARCIAPLEKLGYTFVDHPDNVDRRFFRKGKPRTHHLHMVAAGSQAAADHLDFRDALRADAGLCQRYQELKCALSQRHRHERAKYVAGKDQFVEEALARWRARG